MSLFPAYAADSSSACGPINNETKDNSEIGWLKNDSFIPPSPSVRKQVTVSSSESTSWSDSHSENEYKKKDSQIKKKNRKSRSTSSTDSYPEEKKRKRKHHRSKKRKRADKEDISNAFIIDTKGDKRNLLLLNPAIRTSNSAQQEVPALARKMTKKKRLKKLKKGRYFANKATDLDEERKVIPVMELEEFLKKTEQYNKGLREDPGDVQMWLSYIKLQDHGEGTLRGIAEKKLSIVDKALAENPSNHLLLEEKFLIIEKLWPYDKIAVEAKLLASKDSKNMTAWNWLIKCHQFNLSKMTVPNVLSSYASALQGLHKMNTSADKMLDMLLQCGLFLRQAGLWEHLWVLLELYLELNLTQPGSKAFSFNIDFPEKKIQELEDEVITCGLPLGALWLRIEHLREGIHFLPTDSAEDPQRIVFTDDVSDLLFPVKKEVNHRLIAIVLSILKIPPLPMTDCFCDFIGLKRVPWAYESTEWLLAVSHQSGIVSIDTNYIAVAKDLLVNPQYINEKLGENEFFLLLNSIFENCEKTMEQDKECILVWHMRWWRYVVRLQGRDSKGIRSKAKALLKLHRNSLPLYVEFALLEQELGHLDSSLNIFETAITLRNSPLHVVGEKGDIAHVYRAYVTLLLSTDFVGNKNKVLTVLIALALGKNIKEVELSDESLAQGADRFRHLSQEFLTDRIERDLVLYDLLVPDFIVSWLACHAWFIYLTEDSWQSCALIESAITRLEERIGSSQQLSLERCILENYYEILTNVAHHFSHNNPGHLKVVRQILSRATKLFPDNIYFLNVLSGTEISCSWMTAVKDVSTSTLANLFSIFASRAKLLKQESEKSILKEESNSRMYHLLKKVTDEGGSVNCPLLWKLLLQFVAHRNPAEIKKTFYLAAEKCPWVKSVYYSAAQSLPEELPQIQDLIIEKELRLHITPEELEILREDVPPPSQPEEPGPQLT